MSEMRWSRCEDELPEMPYRRRHDDSEWLESDPCLVCGTDSLWYGVAKLVRDASEGVARWVVEIDGIWAWATVVAWMPIPEYKEGVKVVDWTSIPEFEEEST